MAPALTPKTTIGTLLKEYPFLLAYLAGYHPDFKRLTNPVARRTLGRLATMEQAAGMAGLPVQTLLADVAEAIAAETGTRPETATTAGAAVDQARQEELKAIISELHAGRTPAEVKPRFDALIKDVEATEIAAMEQALIEEGLPETEVKRLCDVHMQVFQDALAANPELCVPAGHPIDTFQRENRALLEVTAELRAAAERVGSPPDEATWEGEKPAVLESVDRLRQVDRHYLRKENQLFPFLERHRVEAPPKVMWALHDDIRAVIKELREALALDNAGAALHAIDEVTTMVDDMVNKEEKVLFPMALDVLSEQEWREIRAGEGEIGYTLILDIPRWPGEGAPGAERETEPATEAAPATAPPEAAAGPGTPLALHTGALSLEQIGLLLDRLPLDLTFVDENDEVRFYSEGDRVFPRSPGVIGRKVQNCHPPASVHKVQEIVDAFRAGEKDVAEFWINLNQRFIHIRYFAIRGAGGVYRGALETVQDVTSIRALQGERRLLDW